MSVRKAVTLPIEIYIAYKAINDPMDAFAFMDRVLEYAFEGVEPRDMDNYDGAYVFELVRDSIKWEE